MSQGSPAPAFGILTAPMDSSQVGIAPPGMPVYPGSGGAPPCRRARIRSRRLITPSACSLKPAVYQSRKRSTSFPGPLALTTDQWDSVTGETGGLVTGDRYFISSATAGKLTNAAPARPVSAFVFAVGTALSPNILQIQLGGPADGLT